MTADSEPRVYYRPIVEGQGGRWQLAGGWTTFSTAERLQRGAPPQMTADIPDAWLERLTSPRAPLLGLTLDRPRLMGIVNATPDSFSDGGQYDPIAQGQKLIAEQADILDIGGESTRPGADCITIADETARILPAISALSKLVPVSVDTRKAQVAAAALQAGAVMINDVSGLQFDPDLAQIAADAATPVCLMHTQGTPKVMQQKPEYADVVLDVFDALEDMVRNAEARGIARANIVVDPGIGFGKTVEHNLDLLRNISLFHGLGCPILLGISRKSFIGKIAGDRDASERLAGTIALTLAAITQAVQIHRVHDVAEVAQGVKLWQTINNKSGADYER